MEPGMNIRLASIDVPAAMLAYHATRTVELAKALRAGRAIEPLAVVKKFGRYVLVVGKDEFAALKLVGAEKAPVRTEMSIRKPSRRNRRGIS
jgi:hypothetical protein